MSEFHEKVSFRNIGEAYFGLWNYEVVECFFLAQTPGEEPDYLELEFGPHGQHLGLLLHGVRNDIVHSFPIKYEAEIAQDRKTWTGKAIIPKHYFPGHVNRYHSPFHVCLSFISY